MDRSRNSMLDMIRGMAALEVALGHLRYFIFVDYNQLEHHSLLVNAFYYLTGFAHQSVIVFFVLSGYLVGGSVLTARKEGFFTRYSVQRLSRLWIVLLPCLAATAVWNILGYHAGGAAFLDGKLNPPMYIAPPGQPVRTDIIAFLGNMFFLQNIVTPVYGDNGPLWSLANEFWYYVIFPLLYFGIRKDDRSTAVMRGLCIGVGIMILFALPRLVFSGFFVWLCGAAIAALDKSDFRKIFCRKWYAIIALIAFIASFHYSRYTRPPDILLGLTFSAILPLLLRLPDPPKLVASISAWVSDFSYTLYLVHFSFAAFLWYAVLHSQRLQPSWSSAERLCVFVFVVIAYSYAISLVFERNTDKLRRYIQDLITGRH